MQRESWTADAVSAPTDVTIAGDLADLLTMTPLGNAPVVECKWPSINSPAVLDYEEGYEDDTDFEDDEDQSDDGDDNDDLDEDDDYELETDDDFDDETELDDDLDEDVFDDDDDDLDDLDDD